MVQSLWEGGTMKKKTCLLLTAAGICLLGSAHGHAHNTLLPFHNLSTILSLSTTPTWKDFTCAHQQFPLFLKNWAWIGLITLKSIKPLKLEELQLQWQGKKIEKLHAALYSKKETEKLLIPIEDNLVCDGFWNQEKQQLIFPINKKIIAVNKYYLVLNFPEQDADKIKHGQFVVPHKNFCKITAL
jgi:hypothetical protein